jgi:ferredoxin
MKATDDFAIQTHGSIGGDGLRIRADGLVRAASRPAGPSSFRSLLELAEACDVPVKRSCRTGACHTCETGLISGSIGYRPEPVDPPPGEDQLLTCCSQPRSDVTLDL